LAVNNYVTKGNVKGGRKYQAKVYGHYISQFLMSLHLTVAVIIPTKLSECFTPSCSFLLPTHTSHNVNAEVGFLGCKLKCIGFSKTNHKIKVSTGYEINLHILLQTLFNFII
jgi:hypothetical protein